MNTGFIVRLKPIGPWRLGPSSGVRNRVDPVLHSDTLYSALTIAARQLGILSEWLAATAESTEPEVRVGSAFPFTRSHAARSGAEACMATSEFRQSSLEGGTIRAATGYSPIAGLRVAQG